MRFKLLILLALVCNISWGQNYPVQTTIQLSPPYTSYLPDYTDGVNSKLQIALNITDINEPYLQVKLKFSLVGPAGEIYTNPNFAQSPISLNFGEPLILSGPELAPYLAVQNLIFPSEQFKLNYIQTKVLPEGLWKLCVDVYDATNPNSEVLSTNNCALMNIARYQVPELNLPTCETTIPRSQSVFFSWTDMALGAYVAGNEPTYEFSLYSVPLSAYNNPTQVLNTNPIYVENTNLTHVNIDTSMVMLPVGQKYLWRVRAILPDGSGAFLNDGYSAPCTFIYGDLAQEVIDDLTIDLTAQAMGPTNGKAEWTVTSTIESGFSFDSYKLEYRKTSTPNFNWFSNDVSGYSSDMLQLEAETEYAVRIKGIINGQESGYFGPVTFITAPYPIFECGDGNMIPNPTNFSPLGETEARPGIEITQGQFAVIISSIQPLSTPGHFKGTGRVYVDFIFTPLNVKFDDIYIDDNFVSRQGNITVLTQGIEEWIHVTELNKADKNEFLPGGIVDSVQVQNDSVVVHIEGGPIVYYTGKLPVSILSEDGTIYYVLSNGSIEVSQIQNIYSSDVLAARSNFQVKFEPYSSQAYGFDHWNLSTREEFEVILLSDGSEYKIHNKSMADGGTDMVIAKLLVSDDSDLENMSFKSSDGTILGKQSLNDSTWLVTIDNVSSNSSIYAETDDGDRVGKLSVKTYDLLEKKLVIVPVNNASVGGQNSIEQGVNEIYRQSVVNWDVEVAAVFNNSDWDLNGDGSLEGESSGVFNSFSSEMKALRDAYKESGVTIDDDAYYLFVIDQFEDPDVDGYMVRGSAVGFLAQSPSIRTISHELGHGAFGLEHTFPRVAKGETNNLMDYVIESHLNTAQWSQIHSILPTISWFDQDEEAQFVRTSQLELFNGYENDGFYTFYSLSGNPISLSGNIEWVSFATLNDQFKGRKYPIGAIRRFKIDGVVYNPSWIVESNQFLGYRESTEDGSGGYFIDTLTKSLNRYDFTDASVPVDSFPHVNSGKLCFENGDFILKAYSIELVEHQFPEQSVLDQNYRGQGLIYDDESSELIGIEIGSTNNFTTNSGLKNAIIEYFSIMDLTSGCESRISGAIQNALIVSENPELLNCIPTLRELVMYMTEAEYAQASGAYIINANATPDWLSEPGEEFNPVEVLEERSETPPLPEVYISRQYLTMEILAYLEQFKKDFNVTGNVNVASQTINTIVADFQNIRFNETYECVLRNIPFNLRLEILKDHGDWEFFALNNLSTDKEIVLVDLIRYMPETDISKMLEALRGSSGDYELFWSLYDDLYNDNSRNLYTEVITQYLIASHDFVSKKMSLESASAPGMGLTTSEYVSIYKTSTLEYLDLFNNAVTLDNDYRLNNGVVEVEVNVGITIDAAHLYEFKAESFDFCKVRVHDDFQFSIQGQQVQAGDTLYLPAFMVYDLLHKQASSCAWMAGRITLEVIAVVATAGTAAPEIIALEITLAGVNIALELGSDYVYSSGSTELRELYGNVSMITSLAQLGICAPSLIKNGQRWAMKLNDNLSMHINNLSSNLKDYAQKSLKVFEEFKNLDDISFAGLSINGSRADFFARLDQVKIYLKSLVKTKKSNSFFNLNFTEHNHLIIDNRYVSDAVLNASGEVVYQPLSLLDNITPTDDMTELMALENVKYMDDAVEHTGDLKFLKKSNGSVVIKALPTFSDYSNLKNLTVQAKQFLANKNWGAEILSKLDADVADGALMAKFEENIDLVDAWNSFKNAGLDDLAKNPVQLQKFDNLAKSNTLGLDAKGLEDLLSAPKAKGLTWDNPDKVLDAVKRSSDANIDGLSISHKKFPQAGEGTNSFVLDNAKQYQLEASGDAALSFNKNGVSFDDVAPDGKLVDRKYGHGSSIFDNDGGVINENRAQSILDQAQRQLNAVGGDGSKLRWEISTSTGADGIEQLFFDNSAIIPGIENIEVVHVVQKTIIN